MKSTLNLVLFGFVSILGLVSCMQKNDSHPSDSWLLKQPLARVTRNGQTHEYSLVQSTGPIDADAEIFFPNGDEELKDTTLSIDSTCAKPSGTESASFTIKGVSHFPLLSIIPEKIWLSLDLTHLEKTTCSFSVNARTKLGSTHNFAIPTLQITHKEALESLRISKLSTNQKIEEDLFDVSDVTLQADSSPGLRLTSEVDEHFESDYYLLCDHFSNHRKLPPKSPRDHVLEEMISKEIENHGFEKIDPRHAFTQQQCRLIVTSLDDESGVTKASLSKTFQLKYPRLTQVAYDMGIEHPSLRNDLYGHLTFPNILTITLANSSSAPKAFRFSNLAKSFVSFQIASTHSLSEGAVGTTAKADVTVAYENLTLIGESGDDITAQVAPGVVGKITVVLKNNFECAYFNASQNTLDNPPDSMGISYALSNKFNLFEYPNWDTATSRASDRSVEIAPRQFAVGATNGVLDGWAPGQLWVKVTGNASRPALHLDTTIDSTARCGSAPVQLNFIPNL